MQHWRVVEQIFSNKMRYRIKAIFVWLLQDNHQRTFIQKDESGTALQLFYKVVRYSGASHRTSYVSPATYEVAYYQLALT